MLTSKATPEMHREWRRLFELYHNSLTPNRKTGDEIASYFRAKYQFTPCTNQQFIDGVEFNITKNEYFATKLPDGAKPQVEAYFVGDVFVAIDTVSGNFQVECEDIKKAVPIYDDLFVYRGLDAEDLKNYYLVAQYVILTGMV